MAYTFRGIDPTQSRTGLQAKTDLEGIFGQPLSQQQITQAGDYLGTRGYTDRTGAAQMSGQQYNDLMQEAARLVPGSSFEAWSAPVAAGPPANTTINLQNAPAPTFDAPELEQTAPYQAPDPFAYDPWRATTQQDLYTDPSYQFRTEQGQKALERSAAARGTLRTGGTMQALVDYGQQAASQEFGNVDARRRADFQTGYGAASDSYDRNASTGRYGYEQGVDAAQRRYDAASQGAQAEYAPRLLSWQSQREDANRSAEYNADRSWQDRLFSTDDQFRRERAREDDAYRNRTFTTDDDFRKWLANLQNSQFLAELGTRQ